MVTLLFYYPSKKVPLGQKSVIFLSKINIFHSPGLRCLANWKNVFFQFWTPLPYKIALFSIRDPNYVAFWDLYSAVFVIGVIEISNFRFSHQNAQIAMFLSMRRLGYFSFLSPKRILRVWKQVQVVFLRQGSSKLTSRISFIFSLGSFIEGVNNFVRAQNLPQKLILEFPDGPEYVFLRMKRDPFIFTYKAFSQAVP